MLASLQSMMDMGVYTFSAKNDHSVWGRWLETFSDVKRLSKLAVGHLYKSAPYFLIFIRCKSCKICRKELT